MALYRQRLHTPFGDDAGTIDGQTAAGLGVDLNVLAAGGYRTDWPGVLDTAVNIGLSAANQVISAEHSSPGAASVPQGAPAPAMVQAGMTSGPPWVLLLGAVALYYFVLR